MRSLLVFIVLLAAALAFMVSLGNCVQEDAFISFRYAANLVEGHGLVYNPGERVEGYTNFLWTLLLAAGMSLGADPVSLSRFAGMAAATVFIILVFLAARREDSPRGVTFGLVASAFVAASPSVAAEGVQGLETVFFTLLVTAATLAAVEARREHASQGMAVCSGILLAMAAMTRPEGVGVGGLILIGSAAASVGRRRGLIGRADLVTSAVFAGLYLPYWIWRFVYYGFPFPNTFYAKTGGGLRHVARGIGYVGDFALRHPSLIALTALGAAVACRNIAARRRCHEDPFGIIVGTVVAGYLAYVAVVGGDFKATFRFIIPVLGLWALWVDRALSELLQERSKRLRVGLVAVCVAAAVGNGVHQAPSALRWALDRTWDLERRTAAGRWLREYARSGDTLAIHSAGIIPYYSKLYTIDMWGLNDLHIGHREMPGMGDGLAGHEKSDPAYVFGRRPTYYVDEYAFVTPRPLEGFKGTVLRQFPLREIRESYRERRVQVVVRGDGKRSREWFLFLERLPGADSETD